MEAVENWIKENTIECPVGKVSKAQCEALRNRPQFNPQQIKSIAIDWQYEKPYRPTVCDYCEGWEAGKAEAENNEKNEMNETNEMNERNEMNETKRCNRCGQELPLAAFGRNSKKKDGLQNWCKECKRAYDREQKRRQREEKKNKETGRQGEGETVETRRHGDMETRRHGDMETMGQGEREYVRCGACGKPLSWYDSADAIGFTEEHYTVDDGPLCLLCFARLYGRYRFRG